MSHEPRKMSELIKEMSEVLLRHPDQARSSEAAHASALFANIAWNESVGMDRARDGYRNLWETFEAENPELWNEFKSNDINAMIDELVRYKQQHFPNDMRRILTCGVPDGKLRLNRCHPPDLASTQMQKCRCMASLKSANG